MGGFGAGRDIDGYDFEQLVQVHGALPPARAIRLMLQVAASLEEAHSNGLVHRDVKPSNLMLTERGGMHDFVKVLDFGLARPRVGAGASAAQSVMFAGTPGYAAPEVIAGSPASPASDVFSLGAVGHFLTVGQGPFSATGSSTETLTRTLATEPAALPGHIPPALGRVLMACLEKMPDARPSAMAALSERLRDALASCSHWTREDAERWWGEHPPRAPADVPPSEATFVPADRALRAHQRGVEREVSPDQATHLPFGPIGVGWLRREPRRPDRSKSRGPCGPERSRCSAGKPPGGVALLADIGHRGSKTAQPSSRWRSPPSPKVRLRLGVVLAPIEAMRTVQLRESAPALAARDARRSSSMRGSRSP